jgi:hypothetical protein
MVLHRLPFGMCRPHPETLNTVTLISVARFAVHWLLLFLNRVAVAIFFSTSARSQSPYLIVIHQCRRTVLGIRTEMCPHPLSYIQPTTCQQTPIPITHHEESSYG